MKGGQGARALGFAGVPWLGIVLLVRLVAAELAFNSTDAEIRSVVKDWHCALPNYSASNRTILSGNNEPIIANVAYRTPGLGNYLIFFPAVFWLASFTGRAVTLGRGSLSEFCGFVNCSGFAPSTATAIHDVGKFDFAQHFLGKTNKLDHQLVRGATIVPASDWWAGFPFLSRCVSKLSRCTVGDVGCAERFAMQQLVKGPFRNLSASAERRLVGMPESMLHLIKTRPHAAFTLPQRISAAFHVRREFMHFENASDPNDPGFVSEIRQWINGSEFALVASEFIKRLIQDVPQLVSLKGPSSNNSTTTSLLVWVSGDNNRIKRELANRVTLGTRHLLPAVSVQVSFLDSPQEHNSKNRLVIVNGQLQPNDLSDQSFDWYALSLSNFIYGWRLNHGGGSTFVGSASKVSGNTSLTNSLSPIGEGGIFSKKFQLIKSRRGVCCHWEQEWSYRFDQELYSGLTLQDVDKLQP